MLLLILQTTGIVAAISGILAIILVIAERYLADYGDCKININGKKEEIVKGGSSLLSSLNEKKIYLASACGGRGSCGFCKCQVLSGGGPLLPTEKPFLSAQEIAANIRLACQVKIREDISIKIPEAIFNIRKFRASVENISDLTYDIKELTFRLLEPKQIDFKAGQYLQLHSQNYGKVRHSVSRAYSISSNPSLAGKVQLLIRRVPEGICTTWVHEHLKEGDEIEFTGPFGDFYIRETEADIFFIAGGSGKAPIKAMVEWLAENLSKRHIVYFFGARTLADLYYTEYFENFAAVMPDFTYIPVLSAPQESDNWKGRTGFINQYFKEFLRDPANTEAYLCGSPGMINAMVKSLKELSLSDDRIFYDSF